MRSAAGAATASSAWSCARVAAAGLLTKHGGPASTTRASTSGTLGVGTVSTTPSGPDASNSPGPPTTRAPGCSATNLASRSASSSHTTNSALDASDRASVNG
jgi:hypothetical protein